MNGIMPRMAAGVDMQEAGSGVLVHDRTRAKIHIVNRTAAAVLRACDGSASVRSVAERFDPSRAAEIEREIAQVLEEFARLGLVSA